ncbi:MAG: hypothetical protein GEV11_11295 [Streptosporangiales bacterium]|nr:hypothetical protein [Streptosporangiales bacterium]
MMMLEPISGDEYLDDLADPDRARGALDMRASRASDIDLELDSLDFLAFVEMVRESPAERRTNP